MPVDFSKSLQKKPSLIRLIHSKLGGGQEPRPLTRLHGSDITKSGDEVFCPRERALIPIYNPKLPRKYINTALDITFQAGWDMQERIVNQWLRDDVVGGWKCRSCGDSKDWGKFPKEKNCGKPANCYWEYREKVFTDRVSKISGSLDFLVDFGRGYFVMVECKIMAPSQFDDLKMPLSEHRLRTILYLHLIRNSDDPLAEKINKEWAFILYCSRAHGRKSEEAGEISPFKTFIVEYDQKPIQEYLNKAFVLDYYKRTNRMVFGVCDSEQSKRAAKCPVRQQCFSDKHKPEITWMTRENSPAHSTALAAVGETAYNKRNQVLQQPSGESTKEAAPVPDKKPEIKNPF